MHHSLRLALPLCTIALLFACNDSASGNNISSIISPPSTQKTLSGIAIDGYLNKAKVCLDINRDLACSKKEDGHVVFSDNLGHYKLAIDTDIDISQYSLIVEAIPGTTIDMDNPLQKIKNAYVLSAPADHAKIVSPYSTVIEAIAKQQNLNFKEARNKLASSLKLNAQDFEKDYVASTNLTHKKMHIPVTNEDA
ncbi:hypothetical protein JI57_03190 [Psychromonas sp. PRT-SC03]|nr:hypothetical protein JI57_03190 [Psychromonas sp. PRT-SC03]